MSKRGKTRPHRRIRKTPSKGRKRVIPIWKKRCKKLTPQQKEIRYKSLEALSLVRREKLSLRKAAKEVRLDPRTVKENTNAFHKVHGRWKAKLRDRIPREILIYEKGHKIMVEIADSRIASLIGKYHNLIKEFLVTGNSSLLLKLPKKQFRDIHGKLHTLETDPKTIFRIKEREPKPEYFQIYPATQR